MILFYRPQTIHRKILVKYKRVYKVKLWPIIIDSRVKIYLVGDGISGDGLNPYSISHSFNYRSYIKLKKTELLIQLITTTESKSKFGSSVPTLDLLNNLR
ncbi:MAG: hypothetical protein ACI8WT_004401 [Clostridium sp.]|jgi:hypothetical protein